MVLNLKKKRMVVAELRRGLSEEPDIAGLFAEQLRVICDYVQNKANRRPVRSLLITSPAEGDGKTTVAVHLATVMARRGERILLIDANYSNPALHRHFGKPIAPGLSKVLTGHHSLDASIQSTMIGSLDVLPCGHRLGHMTDLLVSEAMTALLLSASGLYDRVIVDCPAVLALPEATNALSQKCDGVVLLLQCGKTTHGKALEAKRSLSFAGANIIGAILSSYEGQTLEGTAEG